MQKRWEYKVVGIPKTVHWTQYPEFLQGVGDCGWELVAVSHQFDDKYVACLFKREKGI